jgi:hypothetical protein
MSVGPLPPLLLEPPSPNEPPLELLVEPPLDVLPELPEPLLLDTPPSALNANPGVLEPPHAAAATPAPISPMIPA